MANEDARPAKPALGELKHFGRQFKGLLAFIESLEDIDSFDAIITTRKAAVADLGAKIAEMESKAVDHEAKIGAEMREVEARKESVEAKLAASQDALKVIGDHIDDRDAELSAAIASRSDDLARATAEADQRLAQLNRDISAAEDRLTATQTSLKKLREHLGA